MVGMKNRHNLGPESAMWARHIESELRTLQTPRMGARQNVLTGAGEGLQKSRARSMAETHRFAIDLKSDLWEGTIQGPEGARAVLITSFTFDRVYRPIDGDFSFFTLDVKGNDAQGMEGEVPWIPASTFEVIEPPKAPTSLFAPCIFRGNAIHLRIENFWVEVSDDVPVSASVLWFTEEGMMSND